MHFFINIDDVGIVFCSQSRPVTTWLGGLLMLLEQMKAENLKREVSPLAAQNEERCVGMISSQFTFWISQ